MKETLNLILADKYAVEKEDLTVLILARNFVIKESVNLVSMKEL